MLASLLGAYMYHRLTFLENVNYENQWRNPNHAHIIILPSHYIYHSKKKLVNLTVILVAVVAN